MHLELVDEFFTKEKVEPFIEYFQSFESLKRFMQKMGRVRNEVYSSIDEIRQLYDLEEKEKREAVLFQFLDNY